MASDGLDLLEDPRDHVVLTDEEGVGAASVEIGERFFVEGVRFDHAPCRELVDQQFDKADLARGEARAGGPC